MKKLTYAAGLLAAALIFPVAAMASSSITLSGSSVTVLQGSTFVEPGYSANSTVDGDITGQVSVSSVDTSHPGEVVRTYDVTDSALDSAHAERSITVRGSGGGMIPCSGPQAPGWNVSLPGGGCNASAVVPYQHKLNDGTLCPFFGGCVDVPLPFRIITSTPAGIGL